MKISHKFGEIPEISSIFRMFVALFRKVLNTFCRFLTISVKFRLIFIKISPKNRKIHRKTRMKNEISFSFQQKFGRFFAEILKCKRCKSLFIL